MPNRQTVVYHDQARNPKGERRVCWLKADVLAWPKNSDSPPEMLKLLPEEHDEADWMHPVVHAVHSAKAASISANTAIRRGLGLVAAPDDVCFRKQSDGSSSPNAGSVLGVLARYIGHEALMGGVDGVQLLLLRYFWAFPVQRHRTAALHL